jgi:ketosteroid isomerase-like protein
MERQWMGARVMTQQAGTAEAEIRALIEAWADAVRRHDLPAILAHHYDDIIMFDVPPPWRVAHPARASFGPGDGLAESAPDRRL